MNLVSFENAKDEITTEDLTELETVPRNLGKSGFA
jgi:hypothetical protein